MIETSWMDDAAATRLLRVLEEQCMDFGTTVEALRDLTEVYFNTCLSD